jgi:hypothetical protein
MKLPKIFLVLFASMLLYSGTAWSQKVVVNVIMDSSKSLPGSDTIYYDLNRKLTWEDFQGPPDMNNPAGAATASGIAYNWGGVSDGKTVVVDITVYTYFFKNKSWKKPGIQLPYHLQHEQTHFDITRLGAEKLVKEFKNGVYTTANYSHMIKNIYERRYAENVALQQQYDMQTKNSRDVEKQAEWNEKISKEVQSSK